jgi:hypothetical protein
MRMTRSSVAAVVFVLASGFCLAQAPTDPASKKVVAPAVKSLIRKDLLQVKKQDAAAPLRNIFSPRSGSGRPVETPTPGRPVPAVDLTETDEPASADETPEAPPALAVNLRYIGYIESPRRLVALVIFEGLAVAVVEGDVVGEGIRIGKITSQQVEVILPDSSKRTFSLEGE